MAFRWRADDGPTLNAGLFFQGIRTNIAKKPYFFFIFFFGLFKGVRTPLSPPSGYAHEIENQIGLPRVTGLPLYNYIAESKLHYTNNFKNKLFKNTSQNACDSSILQFNSHENV